MKIERKVVDKNMLRRGEAANWLSKSVSRQIVITEFLLTECMAGDSISNLCSDFKTLHAYADQILFLRTTVKMSLLRPRSGGLQQRWIDWRITGAMRKALKLGAFQFRQFMLSDPAFHEFAKQSKENLSDMLDMVPEFKKLLFEMTRGLPSAWVKQLWQSGHVSDEFATTIFNLIRDTAASMFQGRPSLLIPAFYDAIYSFEYRYATACALLAVDWTEGGLEGANDKALRNDLIDMSYVAFGTMFDGLLTKEKTVRNIYKDASKMTEIAILVARNEQRRFHTNNRRRNPYSSRIELVGPA